MNTINNTFSFSRFAAVLKCDLVEHRWRYISVFFIMFIAIIFKQIDALKHIHEAKQLLPAWEFEAVYGSASEALSLGTYRLFFPMLALALICAASDMSAVPFKSKGRSTNYLMMPASQLEKFLSRVLINVVMVIAMAYLALFLADLVRMLYVALNDIEGFGEFSVFSAFIVWAWPIRMAYKDGGAILGALHATGIVLTAFYIHSLFLLGGCIWRKGALLKVLFVGFIITLLCLWIGVQFIEAWIDNAFAPWFNDLFYPWLDNNFETPDEFGRFVLPFAIPVGLVYAALIVLNWWLCYRLFSRKQMIPRTHMHGGAHWRRLSNKLQS